MLTAAVTMGVAIATAVHSSFGAKPHIVFLFVDNVGWANVGFHRDPQTPEVVTPNLDALAKSGIVSSGVCGSLLDSRPLITSVCASPGA